MTDQNFRFGAILMTLSTFVFAMQDGISRHLADTYNVYMVVMIRYWFFALFVLALAARRLPGGIAARRANHGPPRSGASSPRMSASRLDLPEPDGPIRKANSPLATSRLTLDSAGRVEALYCLVTLSSLITRCQCSDGT